MDYGGPTEGGVGGSTRHNLDRTAPTEDVARRFGIPDRVLRSINDISYGSPSPYGTSLLVPIRGQRQTAADHETPRVVVPQTRFHFADRRQVFYRTRRGDSLAAVARHFSVDSNHLAAWNDVDPRAALVSGLVLQLFVDAELPLEDTMYWAAEEVEVIVLHSTEWHALQEAEEQADARRRRTHTVARGDTVARIANRFGVQARDIVRWNDLGDEALIRVGQELVVGR